MSKTTDFLFQGKPPPNVNKYSTTSTAVPVWLENYVQGTLSKANKIAAQPYQDYNGQRIAAPTADMTAGWQMARDTANSYQPYFQSAQASLANSGAGGAAGAASPFIQQAAGMSATGAASGALGAASGINAMGTANPYLSASGQSSAGLVNGYLSPYQSAVVDNIGRQGQQTLQSNLHTLGDDFIKAGSLGGTRHMDVAGRAAENTTRAVTDAQAQYMDRGYQTALGAAQNDLARYGQLGQTAGQLALGQQQNLTNIGQTQGQLTLGEQQNMGSLGQMAGNFSSIDSRNMMDQATQYGALGTAAQRAGLTGAAALEGIGNAQRGIDQSHLDLQYQDFVNQRDYAKNNVDWMRGLTTGMPNMGGTVYESSNAPLPGATYGPSGLGQIVGGLSLANNIGSIFKADGGYIDAEEVMAEASRISDYESAKVARRRARPPADYDDYRRVA